MAVRERPIGNVAAIAARSVVRAITTHSKGREEIMVTVSVIGGSGYAGGEAVRLLLDHPEAELRQVTIGAQRGQIRALGASQPAQADRAQVRLNRATRAVSMSSSSRCRMASRWARWNRCGEKARS